MRLVKWSFNNLFRTLLPSLLPPFPIVSPNRPSPHHCCWYLTVVVKCAVMSHWMRLISPGDTRTLLHRTIIATIYIRERWWPLFIVTLLPCPPLTDWHEYWATTITSTLVVGFRDIIYGTQAAAEASLESFQGARLLLLLLMGRWLLSLVQMDGCPVPCHPRETHWEIGRRFMDGQQAAQGHFTHSLWALKEMDGRWWTFVIGQRTTEDAIRDHIDQNDRWTWFRIEEVVIKKRMTCR